MPEAVIRTEEFLEGCYVTRTTRALIPVPMGILVSAN